MPITHPGRCGRCLVALPGFDSAFSPFLYAFPVDRLLKSLKYDGQLCRARLLGELLGHAVRRKSPRPDVLVAVPLHRTRRRRRGFNQAREIAAAVMRVSGIRLLKTACVRSRDTPPLWGLSPVERRRHVRDAFRVLLDLHGVSVALIDDVMTTGATADAVSRSLYRSGAARVEVWTVARAS